MTVSCMMVSVPSKLRDFSLHHHIQTGSEALITSYPLSAKDLLSEVKWPEHEADHTFSYNAKVKNEWALYVFSAWCLSTGIISFSLLTLFH